MRPNKDHSLDVAPADIQIIRELSRSDASSVFEIELAGQKYAMKLFHDNGDPGIAENGRDLNRFRCELNAYLRLHQHHVCEQGFVPYFYGYIDRLDPSMLMPALQHFTHDKFHPRAILLEYLPKAESLNCENYSETCYSQVIEGIKQIHAAGVHHQDVYPKNILELPGALPERIVWIDFDVATTFSTAGPDEQKLSDFEDIIAMEFGEFLVEDQRQGLPKNTKFY
ncbi:hypothetical protein BJY00DRAFT_250714, partial [Aspergillus carlsbadensis]